MNRRKFLKMVGVVLGSILFFSKGTEISRAFKVEGICDTYFFMNYLCHNFLLSVIK